MRDEATLRLQNFYKVPTILGGGIFLLLAYGSIIKEIKVFVLIPPISILMMSLITSEVFMLVRLARYLSYIEDQINKIFQKKILKWELKAASQPQMSDYIVWVIGMIMVSGVYFISTYLGYLWLRSEHLAFSYGYLIVFCILFFVSSAFYIKSIKPFL
jgi:hypothetical protein